MQAYRIYLHLMLCTLLYVVYLGHQWMRPALYWWPLTGDLRPLLPGNVDIVWVTLMHHQQQAVVIVARLRRPAAAAASWRMTISIFIRLTYIPWPRYAPPCLRLYVCMCLCTRGCVCVCVCLRMCGSADGRWSRRRDTVQFREIDLCKLWHGLTIWWGRFVFRC